MLLSSVNLIAFYIALEGLSLLSYGIIASDKTVGGAEAALKYYLYGVVASALLVYGLSLQFIRLKTLSLVDISAAVIFENTTLSNDLSYYISFLLIIAAFLYKLSMFPFHFTLGDVYEGSS